MAVENDKKVLVNFGGISSLVTDVAAATDYYAFGSTLKSSGTYRYGFNGKEQDEEINGKGNTLDFGGRNIYDSRLGRFVSIDPRWREFEDMSPYVYAANNRIYFIDEDGEGPSSGVRLMFYGVARKVGDNSAFKAAVNNVNKDYGNSARVYFAASAKFIIDKINSQKDGSIKSLDIFTHGSPSGLYMVRNKKTQATGEHKSISEDEGEANNLYSSNTIAEFNTTFSSNGSLYGVINSIDMSKFKKNAIIEIHGCRSADGFYWSDNDWHGGDNMATNLSEALYAAGKKRAVVIGHSTKANPLIKGEKTTVKQQDYRHGSRAVYHHGEILFTTKVKRRISQKVINKYLDKKEKLGSKYNGGKEVYKK